METDKQSEVKPHFQTPVIVPIERHLSDEIFHMLSADASLKLSEADWEQIAQICNEDLIYRTLFNARLEGKTYSATDAKGFTEWAKAGWINNDKFVFLIKNPQDQIIGAVDIKSNDLDSAEIGYWISSNTPGVITNSVLALCDIAKTAEFKNLYGLTVPDNQKSQNVLLRAGFTNAGFTERKGKEYIKFIKPL